MESLQRFQVLRCFSCRLFQVHQVKKSNKWNCKACGEKQSLLKVYGQGSGADCRRHVQKLNLMQGLMGQTAEMTLGYGTVLLFWVFFDLFAFPDKPAPPTREPTHRSPPRSFRPGSMRAEDQDFHPEASASLPPTFSLSPSQPYPHLLQPQSQSAAPCSNRDRGGKGRKKGGCLGTP
uniref:MRN complex-interacting protein N-terminal domain-containing protein n=1 Tax=Ornithorhynchus anatinus TaxID=9258 RepID=A0A6I8NPR4_ORNAN